MRRIVSAMICYAMTITAFSQGSGYYLHFGASALAGKSDTYKASIISLNLSNGYKFNNGISAGIGSGIEEMNMPLLPVYAEFGYHPFNSRVSPFIYIRSGYAFSLKGDENDKYWYGYSRKSEGGILINTGAGIVLYTWERVGVNLALGYRFQRVSTTEYSNWSNSSYSTEYVTRFNRLELQFGFIFR